MLWFAHGFKPSDWASPFYRCCPFQCEGTRLPSGMTHHWRCKWWDDITYNPKGVTPF
jgi:hypothetical protein